jgi:hypothetical protein
MTCRCYNTFKNGYIKVASPAKRTRDTDDISVLLAHNDNGKSCACSPEPKGALGMSLKHWWSRKRRVPTRRGLNKCVLGGNFAKN